MSHTQPHTLREVPQEARELLYEGALEQKKAAMEKELVDCGADFATVLSIVRGNFDLHRDQPKKRLEQTNADLGELIGDEYLRSRALLFCHVEMAARNICHMLESTKRMDNEWGRRMFSQELGKAQRDIAMARGSLIDYVSLLAEESRPMAIMRIDSMLDEMRLVLGVAPQERTR